MNNRNRPPDQIGSGDNSRESTPIDVRPRRILSSSLPGDSFGEPRGEHGYSLNDYIAIVLRRRRAAILVFLIILLATAVYTFTRTPMYKSEAILEIDKDNVNSINNLGEALAPVAAQSESFATQTEILKSRTLAEKLLERMNLADSPEFAPAPPGPMDFLWSKVTSFLSSPGAAQPAGISALASERQKRDQLIQAINSRITAKREKNSRLLRVSMEGKNPEFTQQMLQHYVDIYLEQNLAKRRIVSREAGSWLTAELTKAEDKLVSSMANLVKFTNEHGMVSLEEASNHVLKFFDKAAEGLVKSKEHRVQMEAFQKDGLQATPLMPADAKPLDFQSLKDKLSLLESEYMQMREVYSDDYPKLVMLKKQITFLKDKITDAEHKVVSAAVQTAKAQEEMQQEAFDRAKKEAMANNSLGVEYAILKKEAETNEEIYKILLQKSKEMELNIQIIGNNIGVVDAPTLPVNPVKPRKALGLLIGSFIGMIGGLGIALFLEHVDNSIQNLEDVERQLRLPSLGAIPDVRKFKKFHSFTGQNKAPELLISEAPRSPVSEAVRSVKASIFLSAPAASIKSLVISSAGPREGKTFFAVSIASVIASSHKKVLLVDADLRKPRVGAVFGQRDNAPGLSTLLTRNDIPLERVLRPAGPPGFWYLTAGPQSPNPAGLLESERMAEITDRLTANFDLVIFDTPPAVGFSDARILAAASDGVILVVKERYLPAELIRRAESMLATANGRLLGVVLNMAAAGSVRYGGRYSGYYGYYDYYYSKDSKQLS